MRVSGEAGSRNMLVNELGKMPQYKNPANKLSPEAETDPRV